MRNFQRRIIILLLKVFDLLSMIVCFLLSMALVAGELEGISFSHFFYMRVKLSNFLLFIVFVMLWYGILSFFGLYFSRRLATWKDELDDIVKATALGTLLLLIFGVLFRIGLVTPLFLLFFWFYSTTLLIISRFSLRVTLEHLRLKGLNLHYVLMVGSNTRAVQVARNLDSKPELGYRVIGFVDNDWGGAREFKDSGYRLVANFANFNDFVRSNVIDEVIIDLPLNTFYNEASNIVTVCVEQGIIARFISDSFYLLFNMNLARCKLEQLEDNVVISLYTGAMGGWPIIAKRIFDFTVSLLLLALLSPLFIVIALLIKATSKGPVLFVQERVGVSKRKFLLNKFRTMIPDAEHKMAEWELISEVSGPVFKIKDDPRITRVGRLLRKTSLDELPQLINVLQGEMSLVGPRPLPVRDYAGFSQDWQRRRFSVAPGITCLWQIKGRSSIPFEKWMELDLEYIDHWSFWLDLQILARTVPVVIWGAGAY